jgi:alcohol dehydrogenase class IV
LVKYFHRNQVSRKKHHGLDLLCRHIQFDHGAISTLKAGCERVGIQGPMIATDRGVHAAGIVGKAIAVLGIQSAASYEMIRTSFTKAR